MAVFETKKTRGNSKREAEYRKIRVYYKSLEQLKREELRRLRVLELSGQGLTVAQIALQVGVSSRTVQRDLKTVGAFVEVAFKREMRSLAKKAGVEVLGQLEGLSPSEQFLKIRELLAEKMPSVKRSRRVCHKLRVTFDADAAMAGKSGFSFRPSLPVVLASPGVINFRQIVKGECRYVDQITVN